MLSYIFFAIGFFSVYITTRNVFSVPFIFGAFYFLATFNSAVEVFSIASISFAFIGVGHLFYNLLFAIKPKSLLLSFRQKEFCNENYHSSWLIYPIAIIAFLSIGISVYYFSKVGISLFSSDVGFDRLMNRYSVPGARIMQRFFRVYLPIVTIIYFLFQFTPNLKRYYSRLLFFILFIATSFLLVATGMRGNIVIFLFIPFIYIKSLIKPLTFKELFFGFLVTFIIGLYATLQMYSSSTGLVIFEIIWSRLTSGASDGLSYIIGGYTESQGLQFGLTYYNDIMSIFNKLGIVSTNYVSLGEEVAMNLLGSRYNGERAAVYFSGELFHNFGKVGVIIGSIIIGFAMQFLYIKTLLANKELSLIAIIGFFTAAFTSILGGPVIATIFDYIVNLTFLVILMFVANFIFGLGNKNIFVLGRSFKLRN